MKHSKRARLIAQLEEELQTAVICYITGDRENLSTRIAPDIIRVFFRHLELIGQREAITLFLYTRGGDLLTPYRLVSLIREYCSVFKVLIPFRAYSAGTLISLGADEIIMGKLSELSPIDPSVANAFNPQDPHHSTARIPVSVEDVSSYIALAKEMAGLNHAEQMSEIYLRLSKDVHPLALGNVYRNYALIRSLGRKLLEMHREGPSPEQVERIIENLTEKLYAHSYMIPRSEAKNGINLNVKMPSPPVEELMWALYENYEKDLQLTEPFNPALLLEERERQVDFEAEGGIIESLERLDAFIFDGRVVRLAPEKNAPPARLEILRQKWKKVEE
jgi:hypothetical protein